MLGEGEKPLKCQKAQTTFESVISWKASVLQLDHSGGCSSTICLAAFFQGFKFFITAIDICYWISHLWPVLLPLGLSGPEEHLLSLVYRSHMSRNHLQDTPYISWMYVPNPNVLPADTRMIEALVEHPGSVWLMNNTIYFKKLS